MPNANNLGAGTYRYGMNGMEQDSEVKGGGNSYTSMFRQYDPRLGRWLSMDPVNYPWQSDYAAFDNNPIFFADPSGAKAGGPGDKVKVKGNKTNTTGKWETKHTDGSLTGTASGSFNIEEFTIVEGKGVSGSWTSEVLGNPTFAYSGSFGQWKNEFGYSGDYNDVLDAWEDKHGDEYDEYVENEIIEEKGRVAVEKMAWFIQAVEVESYVIGPVTGLNAYNGLSSPKTFKYKPMYQGASVVPNKAKTVLKVVKNSNNAPKGYKGGREFKNYDEVLPKNDVHGKKITYREWDVNPYSKGTNRGAERIVTGSDGKSYYTKDHYKSFTEIK